MRDGGNRKREKYITQCQTGKMQQVSSINRSNQYKHSYFFHTGNQEKENYFHLNTNHQ